MLIQVRSAVDNNGKKIRLQPTKLVVAPGNVFQAEVLLKSVLRSGTGDDGDSVLHYLYARHAFAHPSRGRA